MSSRPRVVVIGYGSAGRSFHSYLIALAPGLELAGVASRDAATRRRIVAERACPAYESFEQAVADPSVDAIVLATPQTTHAPLAIAALDAGKHVVVDKPMALSLHECDAMIAASERAGRLLTVFQNRRLDGDFTAVRRIILDGALGDVRWVEMNWQKPLTRQSWRTTRAQGGGRLFDIGVHLLDQQLLLFPARVAGVYCRMHEDYPDNDVESHATVTLSFEDGRTGIVDVGPMARRPKARFYVVGSRATLEKFGADAQERSMSAGDIDAATEDPADYARIYADGAAEPTVVRTAPGRWRAYYENLADVLANGAEPLVKLDEMRRLSAVLDASFASARTGQVVRPAVG